MRSFVRMVLSLCLCDRVWGRAGLGCGLSLTQLLYASANDPYRVGECRCRECFVYSRHVQGFALCRVFGSMHACDMAWLFVFYLLAVLGDL